MTEPNLDTDDAMEMARPVVQSRKTFSIVWLVPLVAIVIGGWLAVRAIVQKGPTITISFSDANGLEAGKTKIKYKEVEIGQVSSIHLSPDASQVIVTAEMEKEAEAFLSETTRFWVVRARVSGSEVSGLATLFSGAYIAVDPGQEGASVRHFQGLETPPVVTTDLPGQHFFLAAQQLGSVDYGSPVYYRQIKVGEVEGVSLDDAGETITVQVFVQAPYHQFVRENSRFWQTSGLDFEMSADGLRVDTESLVSLLVGGIAFGVLDGDMTQGPARENARYRLYETYAEAQKRQYGKTSRCMLYFEDSVRGLSLGAPVEFRGIQVGEVLDINLEGGVGQYIAKIAVAVELELSRCGITEGSPAEQNAILAAKIEKGLRAQLKTGNFLTGQLYVALDYYPDAPPPPSVEEGAVASIPTVAAEMEEIMTNASRFIARLNELPLEKIGENLEQLTASLAQGIDAAELKQAVSSLGEAMQALQTAAGNINSDTLPALEDAFSELEKSAKDIDNVLDTEGPLQYELLRTLKEFSAAAQAVRSLADTLERQPESVVWGKE
jgi:paraquat-inducible protein B